MERRKGRRTGALRSSDQWQQEYWGSGSKSASRCIGLEGTVTVGFIVGADGKGHKVRVVKSSSRTRVDEEAVSTLNGAVLCAGACQRQCLRRRVHSHSGGLHHG